MAQLYFRYGQMNASKSMQLLTVAHNYEESGKSPLLLTPSIDNRYGIGKITSRVGIQKEATIINRETNILTLIMKITPKIDCILIDEAQFLTEEQVLQLTIIADMHNIPIIAYGLKNDYRNQLFEGSKALLVFADKIEEIKTICKYCNKKATMILKTKDEKPVYQGEQIEIGGNDLYTSVCRKHYYNGGKI
jgi:thymidine kinase